MIVRMHTAKDVPVHVCYASNYAPLPKGALEAADFISIASHVDTYLTEHGKLHGVLVHAKSFSGWKDFAAMLAHLKFLKQLNGAAPFFRTSITSEV